MLSTMIRRSKNDFLEWIEFYLRGIALRSTNRLVAIPLVVFFTAVMAVCTLSGWAMFYLKYNDLSLNTDVLIHAVCTGHTLYLYLMYLANKRKFNNIFEAMKSRFENNSYQLPLKKHNHIWDRANQWSLVLAKIGSYLSIIVFSLYIYNAKCFSPQRKLLYPLWVPFSLISDLNYFFTVFLQLSVFASYLFVHVSGHGIAIGGAHFIGASLDILGVVFREVCQLKREVISIEDRKFMEIVVHKHDLDLEKKLKWCVETHIEIIA